MTVKDNRSGHKAWILQPTTASSDGTNLSAPVSYVPSQELLVMSAFNAINLFAKLGKVYVRVACKNTITFNEVPKGEAKL